MTGFTSGKVPGDPQPWVSWGVRYATQIAKCCYYEPRPGHGNENPILAAFRRDRDYAATFVAALDDPEANPETAKTIARAIQLSAHTMPAEEAAVRAHARRALIKLRHLEDEAIGEPQNHVEENFWDDRTMGHYDIPTYR